MIKETVAGLGFGFASTDLGDIPRRTGIKITDQGEKALLESGIATIHSLKFHLHPVGIRSKGGRRRDGFLVFIIAQKGSPVTMEGIEEDAFHRHRVLVIPVLAAPTGGGANFDPVGSLVGGTPIPSGIHEGFKKKWSKVIPVFPIGSKAADDEGKDMGRQVFHPDLRTDEKPAVVDDQGKVSCPGGVIPTDEGIPSFHSPGSGTIGQSSDDSIAATVDEVADLGSTQRP
jgi:hypothetical protein